MFSTREVFLIAALLCFVIFLVLFSVQESRVHGVRQLLLGAALGILGNILYAFGRELPPFEAYEVANVVYASASAAVLIGYRRLYNRPSRILWLVAAIATLALLIALFHYVLDSFLWRTLTASLFQVAIAVAVACTVMPAYRRRTGSRYPELFILWMCGLIAAGHLIRCLWQIWSPAAPDSLLEPSGWNMVVLTFGAFALPVLALGGLLLVHRRIVMLAEHAANRDFLTGAWSRRAFVEAGERELSRAQRTERPLSVLLIDLDNLKVINDTNGHAAGDEALIAFVRQSRAELRPLDYLARIGGDEFAILMPETDLSGAVTVAERLQAKIHTDPENSARAKVTFSAGAAALQPGDSLKTLIKRADAALYEAKAQGRNRIAVQRERQPA
jgi:diguanylate cyclase (GGDEF)-like protein